VQPRSTGLGGGGDTTGAESLSRLTEAVAAILDIGGEVDAVTTRVAAAMAEQLRGPDLLPLFAGRQKSFAAYVDPLRHFIVHCSVHRPGHLTEAHDHGEAWAVYGVLRGRSRYRRFRRTDDHAPGTATLVCERDDELVAGQTDVVRPGHVHLIGNETDEPAWNVVVRPRPIEEVWRRRYDLRSGAYVIHPGSLPKDPAAARS
jgi:predicted metal-dependent enzyme (double-stranded beta helix superfamily)